jgi:hypothetical protein
MNWLVEQGGVLVSPGFAHGGVLVSPASTVLPSTQDRTTATVSLRKVFTGFSFKMSEIADRFRDVVHMKPGFIQLCPTSNCLRAALNSSGEQMRQGFYHGDGKVGLT